MPVSPFYDLNYFYEIFACRLLHINYIFRFIFAEKYIDFTHIPVKCALRNFDCAQKTLRAILSPLKSAS